ncbi:MAG TPA: DEAD/DEAH box helicase [Blastocatellia bacterium]|nr:DEAD/DEAH box helicase [Blastocatellia bacterium]
MNIFDFRNRLIADYASYVKSFIQIRNHRISDYVKQQLNAGVFYPEPLIQLNPSFARGKTVEELVAGGVLHPECANIFRKDKAGTISSGRPLNLHQHQAEAIYAARDGRNYVLTTGTGSGKSLAYIVPIVNHVLEYGSGKGIQAIVVYPMNALANSQFGELEKFLRKGYPDGCEPVRFDKYTGQEDEEERKRIIQHPPDILLTNYVMLELILTRPAEQKIIEAARGLRFLVLDELHTYRGRQGADVALLVRRVRDRLQAQELQCVGTSATIAGGGSFDEQRAEVARVATQLFGAEVRPEGVIMETLRRATSMRDLRDTQFIEELKTRITGVTSGESFARDYESFIRDPLAIWIESTLGVELKDGRLVRCKPQSITGEDGAAKKLSDQTGVERRQCEIAIQRALLAGYECEKHPETGFAPFAFRLHQFISRGDTVYATPEDEETRYLTVYGQQYKPGSRDHVLLPLVFCRECGQEYYSVRRQRRGEASDSHFVPRQLNDQLSDDESEAGFLYFSTERPFPGSEDEIINGNRIPDDWVEERGGRLRVRKDRQDQLPESVCLGTDGVEKADGLIFSYIAAPFRFCLCCGVSYGARQRDDFAKLSSLGSEGRSTATTITSLSAIRNLRRSSLPERARKLLSFTDNRQDASLQAGHFNDFIETTLLRSALYRAVSDAGPSGVSYDELTGKVFDALKLPRRLYAKNPEEKFQHIKDTDRALREVIGYRLYRDLERGWRITMPNLEQCGLLRIEYQSLDELCAAEEMWANCHQSLTTATPEIRRKIAKVLLDYMRRELTINVSYLDSREQEKIKQQSNQRLITPWAIDENEKMDFAGILFARSRKPGDPAENTYLSARGGFGQYLRRNTTFEGLTQRLDVQDTTEIIADLLRILSEAGLVTKVIEEQKDDVAGWQLMASAMRWVVGDGIRAFHDPIRTPNEPEGGGRTNQYFVDFYRSMTEDLQGLEAREHTAQVQYELREEREQKFRNGELPILYCSPTMELGVDIAELNVVNMRNVPPTPANYAQRSGRAGRSGQPALVFTYCTIGSPHDQYFFKRPDLMVSGQVSPPRLDLANQDLVRAHVHAIWLAETGLSLGKSLKEILDVSGEQPTLNLFESVRQQTQSLAARQRASLLAEKMLATIKPELQSCDWYNDGWLDEVLSQAALRFDRTCDRWRELYRAAMLQAEGQDRIIRDASRSPSDKDQARRIRSEAEAQLRLLTEVENVAQSDFYSYRYFASEGFLPGYNFPRLPISAFIPARRSRQRDEFVSRPRFLAISEFGPRSVIYHEGSRYVINKVILPVGEGDVLTQRAKLCDACGYLHQVTQGEGVDLCERCRCPLNAPLASLFRMQNVSTRRRDKINSDEEERLRLGYEIITGVRFSEHAGQLSCRTAEVKINGEVFARLAYGQAAVLWRINLGWTRRKNRQQLGFVLDVERGYWKSEIDAGADDQEDPMSPRTSRVIPYVEDTRNCLLLEPVEPLGDAQMASLQAALKSAIQVRYQLEDNEIAAEPLPKVGDRRLLLFYESAEGGAGVLRRLIDNPRALAEVAGKALEICHYGADGTDQRRAPRAKEDCEAACYDCLMSYYNQREHRLLDRKLIRDELLQLTGAVTEESPTSVTRASHLAQLLREAGSELERRWLRYLDERGHRLPSHAQVLIESAESRPDFVYRDEQAVIYVDGPVHDFPDRRERDLRQTDWLEDMGYTVIRFSHDDEWESILKIYPNIFGHPQNRSHSTGASASASAGASDAGGPDFDLFDPKFHPLIRALAARITGAAIEPGGDVAAAGRVVGSYLAEIQFKEIRLRLIDADQPDSQRLREILTDEGCDVFLVSEEKQAEAVEVITRVLLEA